jgi:hypothetical protein
MLSTKFKFISFAVFVLAAAAILFVYPHMRGESAPASIDDLNDQMKAVKAQIESGDNTPATLKRYGLLADAVGTCNTIKSATASGIRAPFSPAATTLCINGGLVAGDPTLNRFLTQTTGSGIQAGCPLSGSATAVHYDAFGFNLTGCAAFPTEMTATLCGPAGCLTTANTDTIMMLYRNVAAGDPLTANGGLPNVFNAASPCTNARGANDDLAAPATSAGGSTCNQITTTNCVPICTNDSNSGMRRQLGNGRFTIVLVGFGNSTIGTYNLHINVPAAGCSVALAPTSANGNISGRVATSTGQGISNATLTVTGSEIAPMTLRTNGFGYYSFPDLPSGTYFVTVSSKMYTFANPTQTVNLDDNATDINFVSQQ